MGWYCRLSWGAWFREHSTWKMLCGQPSLLDYFVDFFPFRCLIDCRLVSCVFVRFSLAAMPDCACRLSCQLVSFSATFPDILLYHHSRHRHDARGHGFPSLLDTYMFFFCTQLTPKHFKRFRGVTRLCITVPRVMLRSYQMRV